MLRDRQNFRFKHLCNSDLFDHNSTLLPHWWWTDTLAVREQNINHQVFRHSWTAQIFRFLHKCKLIHALHFLWILEVYSLELKFTYIMTGSTFMLINFFYYIFSMLIYCLIKMQLLYMLVDFIVVVISAVLHISLLN